MQLQSAEDRELIGSAVERSAETIVDCTDIYRALAATPRPIELYGHTIPPAWMNALICYENQHGNIIAMSTYAAERVKDGERWESTPTFTTNQEMDWADARWAMTTLIYAGGRGGRGPVPTTGPVFAFQYAIGKHGQPLDIHWHDLSRPGGASGLPGTDPRTVLADSEDVLAPLGENIPAEWDMALLVHLGALDFMACRNVELVPAIEPGGRAGARRLARTGVEVRTLQVRPVGRSSRHLKGEPQGVTPLTSVVGHFAHYGDCCPALHPARGLLFGKIEGRFWIPQHARGAREQGEHRNNYDLTQPSGSLDVHRSGEG